MLSGACRLVGYKGTSPVDSLPEHDVQSNFGIARLSFTLLPSADLPKLVHTRGKRFDDRLQEAVAVVAEEAAHKLLQLAPSETVLSHRKSLPESLAEGQKGGK